MSDQDPAIIHVYQDDDGLWTAAEELEDGTLNLINGGHRFGKECLEDCFTYIKHNKHGGAFYVETRQVPQIPVGTSERKPTIARKAQL